MNLLGDSIDWFQATVHTSTEELLGALLTLPDATIESTRGRLGYKRGFKILTEFFEVTVLDLGPGGYPHVVASGSGAGDVRALVTSRFTGNATRIDVARDALEQWADSYARVEQWAEDHPHSKIMHVGDYMRGEEGRTVYIGAASSERRVRMYEKGKQLGERRDWIRVELQLRPNNKAAKAWAFSASIDALGNSSRAFVAVRARKGLYTAPRIARAPRNPLLALARQYGRVLKQELPEAHRILMEHLK